MWVPRAAIVEQLLALQGRRARLELLLSHREALIEDCRQVLEAVSQKHLAGQLSLVKKAVDAYAEGHDEAALALSVVATETAVGRAVSSNYKKVKEDIAFDLDTVPYARLRLYAALAPIDQFYTKWFPDSHDPAPEALSRHVAVHQADQNHYTPGNALIAVLLATSILRALQEFHELAKK